MKLQCKVKLSIAELTHICFLHTVRKFVKSHPHPSQTDRLTDKNPQLHVIHILNICINETHKYASVVTANTVYCNTHC